MQVSVREKDALRLTKEEVLVVSTESRVKLGVAVGEEVSVAKKVKLSEADSERVELTVLESLAVS